MWGLGWMRTRCCWAEKAGARLANVEEMAECGEVCESRTSWRRMVGRSGVGRWWGGGWRRRLRRACFWGCGLDEVRGGLWKCVARVCGGGRWWRGD